MEDLNSVQRLVQGAYILLTARELNFSCDHKAILTAALPDFQEPTQFESKCYDNVYTLLQLLFLTFSDRHPLRNTANSSFLMFFEFDVYMKNIWEESCELENPSSSFSYDELSPVDTEELIGLKALIERIRILICSRISYDNFEEPLYKLSQPSLDIFMDGNFVISAFNTGRIRQVLAIYRAISDSSFFKTKVSYYGFIKRVYQWFMEVSRTISRILNPSHRGSQIKFNFKNLKIFGEVKKQISCLISRFRIFTTLSSCLDTGKVQELREFFFFWTIEGEGHSKANYDEVPKYLKIKKVFLDFLLGNKFEYSKGGCILLTKEMRFLRSVEAKIYRVYYPTWCLVFRVYKFRILGLENEDQKISKSHRMMVLQELQLKMISTREHRLRNGMIPRITPIDGLPLMGSLHIGFPNYWFYDLLSATTPGGGFETRKDKDIYMEIVESWYQSSMRFIELCLEVYSIDAQEQFSVKSPGVVNIHPSTLLPLDTRLDLNKEFLKPFRGPITPVTW